MVWSRCAAWILIGEDSEEPILLTVLTENDEGVITETEVLGDTERAKSFGAELIRIKRTSPGIVGSGAGGGGDFADPGGGGGEGEWEGAGKKKGKKKR